MRAMMMSSERFMIVLILLGIFTAALGYLLVTGSGEAKTMLGVLIGAVPLSLKWYFDSSPGSDRKTELLYQSQPGATHENAVPVPDPVAAAGGVRPPAKPAENPA